MSVNTRLPHGETLATIKGLAVAASLLSAGQLTAHSLNVPALAALSDKPKGSRLAAGVFAHGYHSAKVSSLPLQIFSALLFGGLAALRYHEAGTGPSSSSSPSTWKLWASAAASVVASIPWTLTLMETPAQKLLWVSEVADSATTLPTSSSGIGVRVTEASPNPSSRGMLAAENGKNRGTITPMEEFEPFEDTMIAPEEYEQLKVKKLLEKWNRLNVVRTLGSLSAGVLGLWAVFAEH